ncbi:MAG: CpsB/CapC family capsule biosynthesis tyrosine phosphatase [Cyclobacteriaceae bacterium]
MNAVAKLLAKLAPSKERVELTTIDFHSHLLPGIDDGVQTINDSLSILAQFQKLGYVKIITTPHIMAEYYPNTPEIIRGKLAELRNAVLNANINISIDAAAEYYLDETFIDTVEKDLEILTFGKKHVLFETSFSVKPFGLEETIFKLKSKGYNPIYAHPERYTYLWEDWSLVEKLKSMEALFQINAISLVGFYGRGPKKMAEKLVDAKMIDFIGSDCHNMQQFEALTAVLNNHKIAKRLQACDLKNEILL